MDKVKGFLIDLYVTVRIIRNEEKNITNEKEGRAILVTDPAIVRDSMLKYSSDKYILKEIETLDAEIEELKELRRLDLTNEEMERASMLFQKYGPVQLDIGAQKG